MRSELSVPRTLLALLALSALSGCDLWAPERPMRLPASSERISTASTHFRVYRYSIHGMSPSALAKIDAFGHGLNDVLVLNHDSATVTLFRNSGDGSFREFETWETCPSPSAVDGEDINGDGYDDILVTCTDHSMLTLLTGNGRGEFQRRDIEVGPHPISAQVAPHVSVAGTYLSVLSDSPSSLQLLYRERQRAFASGPILPTPESPVGMVADVFTRDGLVSYAVASQSLSSVSVYLRSGASFSRDDYKAPESPGQIAAFDLRGQELVDLVVASGVQSSFRVYLNDGTGHFPRTRDYLLPHGPASGLGSSHLRGIPQPEIYFQSSLTGEVIIYPNLGDGNLGSPETLGVGGSVTALITGRFAHRSDDMDIAMIDRLRGQLVILLNEHPNY